MTCTWRPIAGYSYFSGASAFLLLVAILIPSDVFGVPTPTVSKMGVDAVTGSSQRSKGEREITASKAQVPDYSATQWREYEDTMIMKAKVWRIRLADARKKRSVEARDKFTGPVVQGKPMEITESTVAVIRISPLPKPVANDQKDREPTIAQPTVPDKAAMAVYEKEMSDKAGVARAKDIAAREKAAEEAERAAPTPEPVVTPKPDTKTPTAILMKRPLVPDKAAMAVYESEMIEKARLTRERINVARAQEIKEQEEAQKKIERERKKAEELAERLRKEQDALDSEMALEKAARQDRRNKLLQEAEAALKAATFDFEVREKGGENSK